MDGAKDIPPIWVRLNNNRVRDPLQLLRTAETEIGAAGGLCLAQARRCLLRAHARVYP